MGGVHNLTHRHVVETHCASNERHSYTFLYLKGPVLSISWDQWAMLWPVFVVFRRVKAPLRGQVRSDC